MTSPYFIDLLYQDFTRAVADHVELRRQADRLDLERRYVLAMLTAKRDFLVSHGVQAPKLPRKDTLRFAKEPR